MADKGSDDIMLSDLPLHEQAIAITYSEERKDARERALEDGVELVVEQRRVQLVGPQYLQWHLCALTSAVAAPGECRTTTKADVRSRT